MKATRRLIEAIVIGAVAPLVLTAFVSSPALAAGNGTAVGSLQLTATFVNISVYANFSDDDNGNNTAILEWREAGGTWKRGMDLTVDRRQTIYDRLYYNGVGPNPWRDQFRASVLGLTQNTTYEVRVTFSDVDGVIGANPVTGSITTRVDSFPTGTGNTYYVSTSGNDTNPGTFGSPWATLGKAASSVSAGDTVYFRGGTYTNAAPVIMTASGTANNYITFMPYASEVPILDGGNHEEVLRLDGTAYVHLYKLYFRNAGSFLVRLIHTASYNVIDDCTFRDWGTNGGAVEGAITITLRSAYNVIQYNDITDSRQVGGDQRHRMTGIFAGYWCGLTDDAYGPGEGNIYRYNKIYDSGDWATGSVTHGFTGEEHDDIQNGLYKDADIYGNEFWNLNSDLIGCEGGSINCRCWNNILHDSNTNFMGWGPCKIGPLYVYRNQCYWSGTSSQEICIKNAWDSNNPGNGDYGGYVYCYQNTFYAPRNVGTLNMGIANWGGTWARNQYFANNIFYDSRWIVMQPTGANNNYFDYDCVYNGGNTDYWLWGATNYQNITSVRSSLGLEIHGMAVDPKLTDPSNGNLNLQSSSPCIDAGEILVGFNDANSAWPYKGSAPDIGAYEYPTYRLSLDVTPPGTTIIRGNGWYIDGTLVSIGPAPGTIQSGVGMRYAFSGWIVDGVERTVNPISITMDSPHKVTARYETQYHLSLDSEYGELTGAGWYTAGTVVSIGPAPETIQSSAGTRYLFARWIVDDVERTSNPISITMDSPHTVITHYETQYYLSVDSEYGNPQGSGWYYSDSTAEFSVPATVGVIIQHHFTGWSGDSTAATSAASIIVDGPKTVIANWRSDYSRLYIVTGIIIILGGTPLVVLIKRKRRV